MLPPLLHAFRRILLLKWVRACLSIENPCPKWKQGNNVYHVLFATKQRRGAPLTNLMPNPWYEKEWEIPLLIWFVSIPLLDNIPQVSYLGKNPVRIAKAGSGQPFLPDSHADPYTPIPFY